MLRRSSTVLQRFVALAQRDPPSTFAALFVEALAGVWMALAPMPGDVEAARHPHIFLRHDVVEEPLQADSPRWMADEPHMQPDRHHLRLPASLVAQHVEGIAHEAEPLLRRADPAGVLAVIIGKRIRDDE